MEKEAEARLMALEGQRMEERKPGVMAGTVRRRTEKEREKEQGGRSKERREEGKEGRKKRREKMEIEMEEEKREEGRERLRLVRAGRVTGGEVRDERKGKRSKGKEVRRGLWGGILPARERMLQRH